MKKDSNNLVNLKDHVCQFTAFHLCRRYEMQPKTFRSSAFVKCCICPQKIAVGLMQPGVLTKYTSGVVTHLNWWPLCQQQQIYYTLIDLDVLPKPTWCEHARTCLTCLINHSNSALWNNSELSREFLFKLLWLHFKTAKKKIGKWAGLRRTQTNKVDVEPIKYGKWMKRITSNATGKIYIYKYGILRKSNRIKCAIKSATLF